MLKSIPQKINLPEVSLVLVTDVELEEACAVLRHCQKELCFGDVQLLTSKKVEEKGFRLTAIPPIRSGAEYNYFVLKELYKWIQTTHLLIVQQDGYIVNPQLWSRSFLKYDYIGAPWWEQKHVVPGTVGNGGFSLRSRALMETVSLLETGTPEDAYICLMHRAFLESRGFRYAPTKIARKFAYEDGPFCQAFGFHNRWNMDKFLPGQLAHAY